MSSIKEQIAHLEQEIQKTIAQASTLDALEQVRIAYLGRSGSLATLMEQLKALPLEEKKMVGPLLNNLKELATSLYDARRQALEHKKQQALIAQEQHFDVTASLDRAHGSLHIFTHLIRDIEDIFISMGFERVSGPEVDTDYYNFEALNIAPDHPARELHDTFWLTSPNLLLRTHTSTTQIHVMETRRPPLAIFSPGRVFRHEATDATHDFMFMQAECMLIDKNISIAHLIDTAKTFLQHTFEDEKLTIRLRPGYFPFVEPGLEIDARCPFCKQGCSICKHTTWIELLGAGLVHPNVLHMSGISPTEYSGFAFGFGLERLAMIKYGINDIRLFRNSPLAFLDQWS